MATIKDIARRAGVSHGTVSNVINQRGNVSSEKIRLVEETAKALGYTANTQAQKLRKEENLHVAVLLPDLYTQQYCSFYTAVTLRLQEAGVEVSLHLTQSNAQREIRCVADAMGLGPTCLVAVAPTPQLAAFQGCGVPVVLVDAAAQAQNGTIKYFGFDYGEIAKQLLRDRLEGCRRVALFGDTRNLASNRALAHALRQLCKDRGVELDDYSYGRRFMHLGAVELSCSNQTYDLVIATAPERLQTLAEVFSLKGMELPPQLVLSPKRLLPSDHAACFELDYAHLGCLLAEQLSQAQPHLLPPVTVVPPLGFRFNFGAVNIQPRPQEISLLTLPSPTTQVITKLAPHLKKLTGISLRATVLPYDELYNTLGSFGANGHDLVRMDVVWRPRLERTICKPLAQCMAQPEQLWKQFLPALGSAYKSERTLPIDPCVQMLLYRKDLFENATMRRLYYEDTHTSLQLPADYEQFNRIARFFSRSSNPDSPTRYGTVTTYGLATTAACDFLPWFQSMGGSIFNQEGQLQVDSPVMRRALACYLDVMHYAPKETLYWWSDAVARFTAGEAAMVPVFTNHAASAASQQDALDMSVVGCVPLPGNKPCLGGGCIGIAASTKKTEACVEFFHWLYSDEISSLVAMLGGMTPVASVYGDEQLRSLYPWLDKIGGQFLAGARHHYSPLYPDFDDHRFEIILGTAVRNLAMGVIGVDEALTLAQAACDQQFNYER